MFDFSKIRFFVFVRCHKEWHNLTTNIYDAVDQHLAQNHVQYFTDLSDAEKSLVLERAARSLRGTSNTARKILFRSFSFLFNVLLF